MGDRDQLANWLLINPVTGSPFRFAGPPEPVSSWLSRVKLVDADGNEWTLTVGLREGWRTEEERAANLLRAVKEECGVDLREVGR